MIHKRKFHAVLRPVLSSLILVLVSALPVQSGRPVTDFSGPVLEYETLANEDTHPFSLRGEVLTESFSKSWHRAANRFKSTQDCLVKEQRDLEKPDLRLIDWALMTDHTFLNVCLHRIFTSLGNIETAEKWLLSQGFTDISIAKNKSTRTTINRKRVTIPVTFLVATHVPKETGILYVSKSWLDSVIYSRLVYREKISSAWTPEGQFFSAGYSYAVE